ncbi:MAG: hypothetical protein ABR991_12635 [Terracidiphilus sp.]|jgi:hypothetical protein
MRIDPLEEWRRLTEHYRQLSDEELFELEADFGDLTEQAQQILRSEMNSRRLERPCPASVEGDFAELATVPRWEREADAPKDGAEKAGDGAGKAEDEEEYDGEPCEFTWKTPLCECEERVEAWQIYEVLKHAGIESWLEGPGFHDGRGLSYPRVVVAADQLEQARAIIAQPIPQEIIDECNATPEEYKLPVCPKCGAEDPVLESADPVNSWLCESCGAQWSDAVEDKNESA